MSASAFDLERLRRMINEPTESLYNNETLVTYIETYPVIDSEGRVSTDEGWTAAYDLNAAAADLWEEKASLVQTYYNFSADGGKYDQDKLFETAMDKSRYHAARRKPSSKQSHKSPKEINTNEDSGLIYDENYAWWRL